jgi:hypothetical protein
VKQLNFMLDKDLGFRTHDIIRVPFFKDDYTTPDIVVPLDEWEKSKAREREAFEMLKQKLNESPLLELWCTGEFPMYRAWQQPFSLPGGEPQNTNYMGVDETWCKIFDVKLLEGRLWNSETDSHAYNLIVNESTLKHFGITDYRESELIDHYNRNQPPHHIIGIVKDFHFEHLSAQLSPVIFFFGGFNGDPVIASFAPERRQEVLEFMKNLKEELIGGEFTYSFIEDEIAKLYSEDKKVAVICTAFTGMAILISILGLLGVSLFDVRQRRREIAIRKINGAMMTDIISLLLKRYFVLLGVAFAVSVPVTLFVILKYLENFAYKAPVSWWLFAIALAVTLVISLLTLIYQVCKAGSEPPADVVKS